MKFRRLTLILLFFVTSLPAWATHNRAGEIIVEAILGEDGDCGLAVRATIITYTNTLNSNVDRDSLTICWDKNGPCEVIARTNGPGMPPQGETLEGNIQYNT